MGNAETHTDEFIIQVLKIDETRAVTMLYNRYAKLLFCTAKNILDEEQIAKEIVQELFISIWEKRHSLNFPPTLKPYLIKAIVNRCLNHLRNQKTAQNILVSDVDLVWNLNTEPTIQSKLDLDDLKRLFRKTKEKLPPKTRIAFILSRNMKMSYKEISVHMGISQKGVEKHLSKALAIFRKALKEYLKVAGPLTFWMYEKGLNCIIEKVGFDNIDVYL